MSNLPSYANYEVVRQLGKGGMGVAYIVRSKDSAVTGFLALKQVHCQNKQEGNSALKEAKILRSLSHVNVVRYHDVFLHLDRGLQYVCTVMEYCRSGDLAQHLLQTKQSGSQIEEAVSLTWMLQLSTALAYLHDKRVIHRDLKPANVFLHLMSRSDFVLKLGDFGLSATLDGRNRTSQVGTPCYLAPEVLFNEPYAEPVDVWGVGCIFWEMVSLDFLYERRGMLAANVHSDPITQESLPASISTNVRKLVSACLDSSPQERPTARELCKHLHKLLSGQPLQLERIKVEPVDWTQPLMTGIEAIAESWSSGISQLNITGFLGLPGEGKEEGFRCSKCGWATASKEVDACKYCDGQEERPARVQSVDKHGYARIKSAEEEIEEAKRATGTSSGHLSTQSTPSIKTGSGMQSRSQKWYEQLRKVEREAQIRNGLVTNPPSWMDLNDVDSSSSFSFKSPTKSTGSDSSKGKAAGDHKEKDKGKKNASAPNSSDSIGLSTPPSSSDLLSSSNKMADKVALKNHREAVRQGRQFQLNKGQFKKHKGLFLRCIDSERADKQLVVKDVPLEDETPWDEYLIELKNQFGRDVVFEYEMAGTIVVVENQKDFEAAVDLAMDRGDQLDVVIKKARWNSTTEYYNMSSKAKKQWWNGDV